MQRWSSSNKTSTDFVNNLFSNWFTAYCLDSSKDYPKYGIFGFDEYEAMKAFYGKKIDTDMLREFDSYLLSGGFPKALFYDELAEKQLYVKTVLEDIFNKDIKARVKIKNVEAFNIVRNYVINNFGSTISISASLLAIPLWFAI